VKIKQHTIDSAPADAREQLEGAQAKLGFSPNLYAGMANSPAMLKIYLNFAEQLAQFGELTPIEQQVAYLTVSAENGRTYCVGAHSVLASMVDIPEDTLTELRAQQPLTDPKLNAVRNLALALMEHRGWLPKNEQGKFFAAGFSQSHLLEVITILAQKTMNNYFNHIAQTPLDEQFSAMVWESADTQSAKR
jgi:AhpD family alkylhydroperoxidase